MDMFLCKENMKTALLALFLFVAPPPKTLLTDNLALKEAQSGVAGQTSRIIFISPNGKWLLTNKTPRTFTIDKSGQLSYDQLVKISKTLKDFSSLKKEIGTKPAINEHFYIIKYGVKEVKLYCPKPLNNDVKKNIVDSCKQDGQAKQFAEIVEIILKSCK